MSRRAKRPLNEEAVKAADDEIYKRHESDPRPNPLYDVNGNRTPLSATDPAQTALRTEWMDLYVANGGEIESSAKDPTPPGQPVKPCPGDPSCPPGSGTVKHDPIPNSDPDKANLSVRLVHACDSTPLKDGTVRITGPESREGTTAADGWVHFNQITPGYYDIEGIAPKHQQGTTSADCPAATDTAVVLKLQAEVKMTAVKATEIVVLDNLGNPLAAHPILEFKITDGPPNHLFDIQLSRTGAATLSGGPGLAGSWVEADGRDARMGRKEFSSWSNGQTALQLDGAGAGTFKMPLEWWRDQARQPLTSFNEFSYSYRVVTFKAGPTPTCAASSVGTAKLQNNLTGFRVVDLGYVNGGTDKSIRMEGNLREANSNAMFTFVQWKIGGREQYAGTPAVMTRPTVQDYNIIHDSNYPVSQLDRVGTDPRYWNGVYTISPDGKKMSATDAPGGGLSAGFTHQFTHIDFDTRIRRIRTDRWVSYARAE
ncbi:MAG: hypothetical protein ABI822_30880, partial [Bryobacteraceae bacterium]